MTRTVKGLVLRSVKYAESDKLITVLTEEGKLFFKARGIRSITSKNAAGCGVFVYSEFELEERGDKSYLKRATPLYSTIKPGAEVTTIALAAYFASLAEDTARDAETGKAVLRLLMNALYLLSKNDRSETLIKTVFEMRLLAANGLMPNFAGCSVCGKGPDEVTHFFFRFLEGDLICPDCISSFDTDYIRMSLPVYALLRRSVEAAEEKAYALIVPEDVLRAASRISERYLTTQLERSYQTLDFYRKVSHMAPIDEKKTDEENTKNGTTL